MKAVSGRVGVAGPRAGQCRVWQQVRSHWPSWQGEGDEDGCEEDDEQRPEGVGGAPELLREEGSVNGSEEDERNELRDGGGARKLPQRQRRAMRAAARARDAGELRRGRRHPAAGRARQRPRGTAAREATRRARRWRRCRKLDVRCGVKAWTQEKKGRGRERRPDRSRAGRGRDRRRAWTQPGKTARGRELNRPVEIVGEAAVLWMSARAEAHPVAAPAREQWRSGVDGCGFRKQAMQATALEEEGESGVLLDEERKARRTPQAKVGSEGNSADSRRRSSQVQPSMQRVQSES